MLCFQTCGTSDCVVRVCRIMSDYVRSMDLWMDGCMYVCIYDE